MSRTTIVVFTRLPRAGEAKTRMIPVLGAEGAARLQERMTRQVVARAWVHAVATGGRLVVAATGCTPREMRSWLGPVEVVPQEDGDLGERLSRVIEGEFRRGAGKVIVVGADCPRLDSRHLAAAESALQNNSLVYGPAEDGGYYLVGLSRPLAGIFNGIAWGTGAVLAQSLATARSAGIEPALIARLPDVDEAEDLSDGLAALEEGTSISVVIPTLNESENLKRLLPILAKAAYEVIVADGGSSDDTIAVAESLGARVVMAPRGRGAQMNAAALDARGEYLLFLHADTLPPDDWAEAMRESLNRAGTVAGAYRFALDESFPLRRTIEALVALRCRLSEMPYGDQGLFLRRSLFHHLGGFPEWPILEDVEIVKRLRRIGRVEIMHGKALTSSRRWRDGGILRTFFVHQLILFGHAFGWKRAALASLRTPSNRP